MPVTGPKMKFSKRPQTEGSLEASEPALASQAVKGPDSARAGRLSTGPKRTGLRETKPVNGADC